MTIAAGEKLGSYQILGLIGSGGQGEVYRAHDSALKREVAIKVLPAALAGESERISRFQREAELLASLTHSNIAIVHDFQNVSGRQILVMEFVDGETLADRLKRGPLPVDETLNIAKQVAEALEAAHQKGITHRDLKPANIKITPDGKVKVLDFGLAKMFESTSAQDASHSPTLMTATAGGVILGTAAYMSPEQARGRVVDKKTDIWALGCIIYEALTQKQAFGGDNISDTIAGILRGEPDWTLLPPEIPRRLRELIQRCLQKDPHQRIHDAADVRIAIEDAAKPDVPTAVVAAGSKAHPLVVIAFLILVAVALSGALWWTHGGSATTTVPMHLSVQLAAKAVGSFYGGSDFDLSPDGRWLVYEAEHDGTRSLFLQDIRDATGRFINGTEGARSPFFSFDNQWIAFSTGKTLKKVPVTGGAPISICDLPAVVDLGDFSNGVWTPDNQIFFVPLFNAGIWVVPANGGTPQVFLKIDEGKDRIAYTDPQLLPGNKGILFTLSPAHAITTDDEQIAIIEPGATEPHILLRGVTQARYVPTGHLIYSFHGSLLAVPFDLAKLAISRFAGFRHRRD